jgi:predicted nucleic acid-binding protein
VTVVVDTSIVVKWFAMETDSDLAVKLLRIWDAAGVQPIVPKLAVAELGNVLLKHVIDGATTTYDALAALSELPRFVTILDNDLEQTKQALVLAEQFGRRALYDMHFLALAGDLGCELWTADGRFWQTVSGQFPFVKWLGSVAT